MNADGNAGWPRPPHTQVSNQQVIGVIVAALVVLGWMAADRLRHRPPEGPPPVIRVGQAPPSPAPVVVPAGTWPEGISPPKAWPPACSLLTDEELRAVLPEATAIGRHPSSKEIRFLGPPGPGAGITVPEQSCLIEFDLPHLEAGGVGTKDASLTISVTAVGSTEFASNNYRPDGTALPVSGADACQLDVHRVECRDGRVDFAVTGGASPRLAFEQQSGDSNEYFEEHILPEFARVIAAKVTSEPDSAGS